MILLHGDIVYSESAEKLTVRENSYLSVDDGKVEGIYGRVPEKYKGVPVEDYGRDLIIPAFSDLHVHAPQFEQRGIGMDLLLSDWLSTYTFPEEAKFRSPEYAEKIYSLFVKDLLRQGTMHAAIYATLLLEATDILFELLEKAGMDALVGKVNMDVKSPDFLTETTKESLRDTETFLERHAGGGRVKPILTPRFAPTCSAELMKGLGELARKYRCGVQTHLVESKWEAAEAVRLFPDCSSDAEIYEKAGLLDTDVSIFGHVIFPTEEDYRILRKHGSFAVHCPDATNNVIAGIAPVRTEQERGIRVALGSDVGAGHGLGIFKQAARAVQLSKLKEFYEPDVSKTISFANAFDMATRVGGSLFGKVGTFGEGYDFDALVIGGTEDPGLPMDAALRLERFCYTGDDRNIRARYLKGRKLGEE